jgi:hypothetical protein
LDALLLITILLIVSPPFLYIDRVASTIVVFALLALMWVIKALNRRQEAQTGLQAVALAFIVFAGVNAVMSLVKGNRALNVLNDVVPGLEIYIAFRLGATVEFSRTLLRRRIPLILQMILARGIWHLVLIFTGQELTPPVTRADDPHIPWVTLSGLTYVRPIDPLMGLAASVAFVLYLCGVHRRLSLAVMGVSSVVCLLGMTRAEWAATAVCMCVGVCFMRQNRTRKLVIAGAAATATLYILTLFIPDLGDVTKARLIQQTIEQVQAPDNDLARVRFLEYQTAFDKFTDAPLLGNGLGSNFRTSVFDGYKFQFEVIHNFYLNLLANEGALGIVLFCAVVFVAVRISVAIARSARSRIERALGMSAMTALLWWGILLSMHPIYSAYHVTVVIGSLYGVMLAARRSACIPVARSNRLLLTRGAIFRRRQMPRVVMARRTTVVRT